MSMGEGSATATKNGESAGNAIGAEATARQRLASDPDASAWVGASAGSGKTKVLTDRMLRLLMPREDGRPGTRPDKILALTFTKAGANEMALRLSRRLSDWAVWPDGKLDEDIETNLLGRPPTDAERLAARRLFAQVVDTPGGLKIMTIHSFCQSILGRFPVEAGLAPGFVVMDEEQAAGLLARAKIEVLTNSRRDRNAPLAAAVEAISALLPEDRFDSLISTILSERNQTEEILGRLFGVDGLYTNLCTTLGLEPGLTETGLYERFCARTPLPRLADFCQFLDGKNKTATEQAATIQRFIEALPTPSGHLFEAYRLVFLTVKDEPRKFKNYPPELEELARDETARLLAYDDTVKALSCIETTTDLFRIATAIIDVYDRLKRAGGMLDYDDLILRTLALLRGQTYKGDVSQPAAWVMYKLDEGLDHILVDEAQDTNPEQWSIISSLTDEFFSGEGAADPPRSIFVVGDDKQSIFGFQRAAPEKMSEMHGYFRDRIESARQILRNVDINISFRSVQPVLDAVDTVFSTARQPLTANYLNHVANRRGQAGLVELWPVHETLSPDNVSSTPWDVPDNIVEQPAGSLQLAERIAATIDGWLRNDERLEAYDRPIRAGDILILVRSRNYFVGQLVRALKSRRIPVSGVDRMVLGEQLAVQDLCAAATFALLPDDDLTLACLLKSPFIGLSEERLYDIAQPRGRSSLWQAVRDSGETSIILWLERIIRLAGDQPPYEFFSRLLQEPCPADAISGFHAVRARLGEDAIDPIEEFLNRALTYEQGHSAGLEGYLHWHMAGDNTIKRQSEEAGHAVRIMTVHAAKGLQAPIVFLPDTIRSAASVKPDHILWPHKTGLSVPLFVPSKGRMPDRLRLVHDRLVDQLDREYSRLLYVAMTRAEERLYIAGYSGKKGRPAPDTKTAYWYEDIENALSAMPGLERLPSGIIDADGQEKPILRLSHPRTAPPDKAGRVEGPAVPGTAPGRAPWLSTTMPDEPVPPRPLVPSRPSEPDPPALSPLSTTDNQRFRRGNITHKLLQILPDLPRERRRIAAEQYVSRPGESLDPALGKNIVEEVMAILDDPVFGEIFSPGSLAEVPVSGLLADGRPVSGQIDRLLVRDKAILVVDFKTNRPPPQRPEDVPAVYARQLSAYASLLRGIYPDRSVRCALLWTDGARLMEIAV